MSLVVSSAMAIKNHCVSCHQVISAPEELRGQSVSCPGCGAHHRLISADEVRGLEDREQAADELKARRQADLDRLNEQQPEDGTGLKSGSPTSADVSPAVGPDQEVNGGAVSAVPEARRVERLREIADVLLLFGYVLGLCGLGAAAAAVALPQLEAEVKLVGALVGFIAAAFFFITFKYLSELTHSLAEVAHLQWEIAHLLASLRDELRDSEPNG